MIFIKQTGKEALLRALYRSEADASGVPDGETPDITEKTARKMNRILSRGKTAGKGRTGMALKIFAAAAAAAVALTAAVAASGEMREKIAGFIVNLRGGESSDVYFEPDGPIRMKVEQSYLPQSLPAGFTESLVKYGDAGTSACWSNAAGDRIVYEQGTNGSSFMVNCEGSELEYLTLGGKYKAVTLSGSSRTVIWYRDGYLMYLSVPAYISGEELIATAESVAPVETNNY